MMNTDNDKTTDPAVNTDNNNNNDNNSNDNSNQQQQSPQDRPRWLPEKFMTPEELARAYGELEQRLGSQQQQKEQDGETEPEDKQEPDEKTNGGLSDKFEKYTAEFAEKGELSEESYKELEDLGFPKQMVDAYVTGLKVEAEQQAAAIYNEAGGKETYEAMVAWAAKELSEDEIKEYNEALDDPKAARFAVRDLYRRYLERGRLPNPVKGKPSRSTGTGAFESKAQMIEAMKDPRYKTDPAYREEVARRLALSTI